VKHLHAIGSAEKYSTKEYELVISNSLATCIGRKKLWEEDSNMVSISSSLEEILDFNGNVFPGMEYDGMSIGNAFFTESNIRYSPPSYKEGCTTYAHSLSIYVHMDLHTPLVKIVRARTVQK